MKRLIGYMLILFVSFSGGFTVGHLIGYHQGAGDIQAEAMASAQVFIQAETDYYHRATLYATKGENLTKDEALTALHDMQRAHQLWFEHPEWYDYDLKRQMDEVRLVRVYGQIIRVLEQY